MEKITYLGPQGATFSELAYVELSELFGAPSLKKGEYVEAKKNEDVLPKVINHGGFGCIAMETEVRGRVDGPVNTFIQLLENFETSKDCLITVIGAIKMPVSFALMAQPCVKKENINMVVAHQEALGACKNTVSRLTNNDPKKVIKSDSNGEAAEAVATQLKFVHAAALGPECAATKYGLEVLEKACEDRPAATTFFLLGPKNHNAQAKPEVDRSLLVFRVKHESGSLVKVLLPFSYMGLSLRQLHSLYTGEGQYDFAVEIECKNQADDLTQAMEKASKHMMRHILFGPFPVL